LGALARDDRAEQSTEIHPQESQPSSDLVLAGLDILHVLREEKRQDLVDEGLHVALGGQRGGLRLAVPDQRLSEGMIELMQVVRARVGRFASFK
ncbi:MAG TPA: hypothetical protein VIP78_12840, partial [Candidatus Dormibacteraeota bacterium]